MKRIILVMLILAAAALPAAAQTPATGSGLTNWTFAGVGLAFAVAFAAIAQSRVAAAAAEGMARNPAARPGIQLALFLGLAFIESLVLFVWVMVYLKA